MNKHALVPQLAALDIMWLGECDWEVDMLTIWHSMLEQLHECMMTRPCQHQVAGHVL